MDVTNRVWDLIMANKINIKITAAIALCFVFIMAIIFIHTNKMDSADDLYYTTISNQGDYLSFIWSRYFTWSSRIPIDLSTLLLINNITLLRVINSVMVITIIISTAFYSRMASNSKVKYYDFIICTALFLAFTNTILKDSVWWVTGSFNYLWPATFALLGFLPYVKDVSSKAVRCALIFCTAFSVFNEQIAVFTIIVMGALTITKVHNKQFDRMHAIQYIIVLICSAIVLLAPGNSVRFAQEMGVGFNDYHAIGFLGKIYYGTTSVSSFLASKYNIVLYVALLMAIIDSYKKRNLLTTSLSVVSLVIIAITREENIFAFTGIENWGQQIVLLIAICWTISILTIKFSTTTNGINLVYAFIFLSSILVVFALGFSPSIFYDRPRTFFFSEVILTIFTFKEVTKTFRI